jgi:hypothetical protein
MSNAVTYTQSPFNKTRKDKFLMVLNIPTPLKAIASKFTRNGVNILPDTLQFSVFGTIVPEINVPAIENRYAGQTQYVTSHSRTPYPPVTVNFTVDNRFNNYWVIYSWLNFLNDASTNTFDNMDLTVPTSTITNPHSKGGFNQYKTAVSIFGLDEYNKRVIEFKYTEAFPTNLGNISYSYRDADELESNFTLNYDQLLITPVSEIESL